MFLRSFKLHSAVHNTSRGRSAVCWAAWCWAACLATMAWPLIGSERVMADEGRLATFSTAGGEHYFALSYGLKPGTVAAQPAAPRDVVVLVDTSASQTGAFRDDSLAAVQSLLSTLLPTDRVKLLAVDLGAVPLTSGFVAPNGPEVDAALAKLQGPKGGGRKTGKIKRK